MGSLNTSKTWKNICLTQVSTVPVIGLALSGARTSTGTLMIKFGAIKGLISNEIMCNKENSAILSDAIINIEYSRDFV